MYSQVDLIGPQTPSPQGSFGSLEIIVQRCEGGLLVTSHWTVLVTAETPIVLASAVPSNLLALFIPCGTLSMGIFGKAAPRVLSPQVYHQDKLLKIWSPP